ncbi:MAG TPA: biotin--[acetyl-CoA-carboxylase] ligase [Rectinema sp.]|nr:biotin--[acetyl-CoA-carboxylase] ligase [Rectinema sp.]HOH16517.1 biotin--[acetyl-CoA-carboxylase] ligase [Rectinema sp.]HOO01289.1 biotin--[acetyl-CoA-carboxylase] ligase [Rectinema sp.]HOR90709.1 biotin--[acetyl-CoA-carboxylase] ligase [Rectinema sp.]HPB60869.1 biotin--[acetyl-CoA-carboxylase] ligase [Rectinema sp.]
MRILSYKSIDSTMDEARRILQEGLVKHITIVRADTQTAGRGRIEGRAWIDMPKHCLLMTIILPQSYKDISAIPLRAGLGVVRALENSLKDPALETQPFPELMDNYGQHEHKLAPYFLLKWPNDIVAHIPGDSKCFGKLCGILCEQTADTVLIGIGLNLLKSRYSGLNTDLSPLSLEEALGFIPRAFANLDDAACSITEHVIQALHDPTWHSEYEHRLWGRGALMRFIIGHPRLAQEVEGICVGTSEDGSLILSNNGKKRKFVSGEISLLRFV